MKFLSLVILSQILVTQASGQTASVNSSDKFKKMIKVVEPSRSIPSGEAVYGSNIHAAPGSLNESQEDLLMPNEIIQTRSRSKKSKRTD
jgi:hypothetical protein